MSTVLMKRYMSDAHKLQRFSNTNTLAGMLLETGRVTLDSMMKLVHGSSVAAFDPDKIANLLEQHSCRATAYAFYMLISSQLVHYFDKLCNTEGY